MNTRRSYTLRTVLALVMVFAAVTSALAAKEANNRARNIYQLFMKVNPKLNAGTAKKYVDIVMSAAQKYKQDAYVIAAVIVNESTVKAKAISKGGDYGLMQVRWKVHEKAIKKEYPKVKKPKDFLDPRINIFFGTRILSECAAKSKNLRGTLMRYTGGGKKSSARVIRIVDELRAMDTKTNKKKS